MQRPGCSSARTRGDLTPAGRDRKLLCGLLLPSLKGQPGALSAQGELGQTRWGASGWSLCKGAKGPPRPGWESGSLGSCGFCSLLPLKGPSSSPGLPLGGGQDFSQIGTSGDPLGRSGTPSCGTSITKWQGVACPLWLEVAWPVTPSQVFSQGKASSLFREPPMKV